MSDPDPSSVTARAGSGSKRQGQRRVPGLPTVLASAACFLVVFEFLAFQLRSGRDPALGGNEASAVALRQRPVVIHRRIIVRRVVEAAPAGSGLPVRAGAPGSSTASSSSAAAPAPAAATPVPAAPAPAPVTTTS
jgi:hypothetical protein